MKENCKRFTNSILISKLKFDDLYLEVLFWSKNFMKNWFDPEYLLKNSFAHCSVTHLLTIPRLSSFRVSHSFPSFPLFLITSHIFSRSAMFVASKLVRTAFLNNPVVFKQVAYASTGQFFNYKERTFRYENAESSAN